MDDVQEERVRVLKPLADGDAPQGVEDGQVELVGHVQGLLALKLSQEAGELLHLLLYQLLHACQMN